MTKKNLSLFLDLKVEEAPFSQIILDTEAKTGKCVLECGGLITPSLFDLAEKIRWWLGHAGERYGCVWEIVGDEVHFSVVEREE